MSVDEKFETVAMTEFEWVLEASLRSNLSPEERKLHAHHLAEIRRRVEAAPKLEALLAEARKWLEFCARARLPRATAEEVMKVVARIPAAPATPEVKP